MRMTKERKDIVRHIENGGTLMLTLSSINKVPSISDLNGKRIKEDVALLMLKQGLLIPNNDGLFKGSGQTLKLSSKLTEKKETIL